MTRDAEQLGSCIFFIFPDAGKPRAAAPQDGRSNGNSLDIINSCRARIKPSPRRKWRFIAGHSAFPLDAFDQGRFLSANIGPCSAMQNRH